MFFNQSTNKRCINNHNLFLQSECNKHQTLNHTNWIFNRNIFLKAQKKYKNANHTMTRHTKDCAICVYVNDTILLSFSSNVRLNISLQQMFDVSWAFKDINIKASKLCKDKPFSISFFIIFGREKPQSHAVVLIGIDIHSCDLPQLHHTWK